MSRKSAAIAERVRAFAGSGHDPHYSGYFHCFNDQLFFEAHDVLEELWLKDRGGPQGDFFKGLIQLAGAFVHVQKNRRGPAEALFVLALENLKKYQPRQLDLNITGTIQMIQDWRQKVRAAEDIPGTLREPPRLHLG